MMTVWDYNWIALYLRPFRTNANGSPSAIHILILIRFRMRRCKVDITFPLILLTFSSFHVLNNRYVYFSRFKSIEISNRFIDLFINSSSILNKWFSKEIFCGRKVFFTNKFTLSKLRCLAGRRPIVAGNEFG